MKQWINKILIDASNDGGGSRKKEKERQKQPLADVLQKRFS